MSTWSGMPTGRQPGYGAGITDPVRQPSDALLFRYTVKADRDLNKAIERLARARGVSVGLLVQQHFETILDMPEPSPPPEAQPRSPRAEYDMAQSLGITSAMLRLLRALAAVADHNGNARISHPKLAEAAGLSVNSVPVYLSRLAEKRLVRQVERQHHRTPALWHVNRFEGPLG